ncbi:MAG: Spo0B domain-containing protein [Bacillales bacterium]|nr:Spo0B domain-containing protein [Bacillales bacterium]
MNNDWTLLEVLKYVRHDWMNRIQLIKGNLDLGHTENAKRVIDEVILNSRQETRLTNLNLPRFAEWIMTYNWQSRELTLEYEILDDYHNVPLNDQLITEWMCSLCQEIEKRIDPKGENHLFLSIQERDKAYCFFFELSGMIKDSYEVKRWIEQSVKSLFETVVEFIESTDENLQFQVFFAPMER